MAGVHNDTYTRRGGRGRGQGQAKVPSAEGTTPPTPTAEEHAAPEPPHDLRCPITDDLFEDPVQAADGKVYERSAITRWLELSMTSPLSRVKLTSKAVTPCVETKRLVDKWRAEHRSSTAAADSEKPDDARARGLLPTVQSRLFRTLDEFSLHDAVKELDLKMPCIVALGTESVGKSTLLERIASCPVLPRDQKTCTRMAIRLMLRRGPKAHAAVWVETDAKAVAEHAPSWVDSPPPRRHRHHVHGGTQDQAVPPNPRGAGMKYNEYTNVWGVPTPVTTVDTENRDWSTSAWAVCVLQEHRDVYGSRTRVWTLTHRAYVQAANQRFMFDHAANCWFAMPGSTAPVTPKTATPKRPIRFSEIATATRQLMDEVLATAGTDYVEDRVLCIEIEHAAAPSLDLIDLPGLTTTGDGQTAAARLATKVIEEHKDSACFLWVQEAITRPNTSLIAPLIKKYNLSDRTLGVLTKADMLTSEDDSENLADLLADRLSGTENAGSVELKPYGWVAVALRGDKKKEADVQLVREKLQIAADNEKRRRNMLLEEASTVKNRRVIETSFGAEKFFSAIQGFYEQFIKTTWHAKILEHLSATYAAEVKSHIELGMPFIPSHTMRTHLETIRSGGKRGVYPVSFDDVIDEATFLQELQTHIDAVLASQADYFGLGTSLRSIIEGLKTRCARDVPLQRRGYDSTLGLMEDARRTFDGLMTQFLKSLGAPAMAKQMSESFVEHLCTCDKATRVSGASFKLARFAKLVDELRRLTQDGVTKASADFVAGEDGRALLQRPPFNAPFDMNIAFEGKGFLTTVSFVHDNLVETLASQLLGMWLRGVNSRVKEALSTITKLTAGPESCEQQREEHLKLAASCAAALVQLGKL